MRKIAVIDEDDIKVFRAKSYIEPIEHLQDLDANSTDVINIFEKINELDKNGFDLLNRVPDNNARCSVQVKFYINKIIERAKEQCDYCVVKNLNQENRKEFNVSMV